MIIPYDMAYVKIALYVGYGEVRHIASIVTYEYGEFSLSVF